MKSHLWCVPSIYRKSDQRSTTCALYIDRWIFEVGNGERWDSSQVCKKTSCIECVGTDFRCYNGFEEKRVELLQWQFFFIKVILNILQSVTSYSEIVRKRCSRGQWNKDFKKRRWEKIWGWLQKRVYIMWNTKEVKVLSRPLMIRSTKVTFGFNKVKKKFV